MWSHYAEHHRGICVEFDPRLFDNQLKKVRYSDEYPEYNFLTMRENDGELGDLVLLTKAKHWEYEAELRMFGQVGKAQQFPPESITGVIIGCRTTPENIIAVVEAAEKHATPVRVLYAHQNPRRYELEIVSVVTEA